MTANANETWTHVAKSVLLLEDEDIALLSKKRIRTINFFRKTLDVRRLETAVGSKDGLFFELEDFFKYMIGHQPSNDDLMMLTHQDYCDIPQTVVQTAYEIAVSSTSTKTTGTSVPSNVTVQTQKVSVQNPTVVPSQTPRFNNVDLNTQTYAHVTPNIIRTVDFLRYTNFTLGGTDDILKFYADIQTQGSQYNILLKNIDLLEPSVVRTYIPSTLLHVK